MKICVFGAGAIGGHLAARLARGGAAVSVVARGAQLAAIRAGGLRVHAPDCEMHAPVRASDDPADLGPQDAVLVTVKAPALPSVAAAIAPLLRPDTPVAFVMNGIPWWYFHAEGGPEDGTRLDSLDPGGRLWNAVGTARAVGGVVYSACTVTAPGEVHVEHARNRVILGEPDGTLSARTEALAAALRAGGLAAEVSPRIRDAVWGKLLLNVGTGLLAVLTGSAPARFLESAACEDAMRRLIGEAAATARAMGCTVSPDVDGQVRNGRASHHKPSILQDLELGRAMEIDAIYGVPLAFARARGVETPLLALLTAMVQARAGEAGLYRPVP